MLAVCLALLDTCEDKKAFEILVNTYEGKLYAEAFRILQNHELAEEALWDSFGAAARSFAKISDLPDSKIGAYLLITVRNNSYRIYNREKKHLEGVTFENMDSFVDEKDFESCSLEELTKAVSELDDKYKAVVAYFYYYGLNAEEISEIMNISKNVVYKDLNKAKHILHSKLGGKQNE